MIDTEFRTVILPGYFIPGSALKFSFYIPEIIKTKYPVEFLNAQWGYGRHYGRFYGHT